MRPDASGGLRESFFKRVNLEEQQEGMLHPYRVLDLTDEKGWLCGKLLGDLGADVIKVEPPGGDPGRNLGPFYHDEPDPDKSLYWFAFNNDKRGITLNIETADGQDVFKKLVKTTDVIIESSSPGYMDKFSLGYQSLLKVNPQLTMVSITPFGQTGPYKDHKGCDISLWAMGNHMFPWGDGDRPPVRVSYHSHAYLNAGTHAAVGAVTAIYSRAVTGEGQQIDVSIQECVARLSITAEWDQNKTPAQRGEWVLNAAGNLINRTYVWPCKDGEIVWYFWGGPGRPFHNPPLLQWMDDEGMLDDFLRSFNWDTLNFTTTTQDVLDKIAVPTSKFFMSHTKKELFEEAIKRRVILYPVSTTADIVKSPQLADRQFWVDVEHPELGANLRYPGAFIKSSETPPRLRRRAPLIGEHNEEIYRELGLTKDELVMLKQAKVI